MTLKWGKMRKSLLTEKDISHGKSKIFIFRFHIYEKGNLSHFPNFIFIHSCLVFFFFLVRPLWRNFLRMSASASALPLIMQNNENWILDWVNLLNCAGITSGSRSSSSSSVVALISLLELLLYCHRGLAFEYFCSQIFDVYTRRILQIDSNQMRAWKVKKKEKGRNK